MKALAVYEDVIGVIRIGLDVDSHFSKTIYGRQTVSAGKKMCDFSGAVCQAAKHHGPVRNGLVAGNVKLSVQWFLCWEEFHKLNPFVWCGLLPQPLAMGGAL